MDLQGLVFEGIGDGDEYALAAGDPFAIERAIVVGPERGASIRIDRIACGDRIILIGS